MKIFRYDPLRCSHAFWEGCISHSLAACGGRGDPITRSMQKNPSNRMKQKHEVELTRSKKQPASLRNCGHHDLKHPWNHQPSLDKRVWLITLFVELSYKIHYVPKGIPSYQVS
ncbi:unnamed protein product [Victoria cruziana]